MSLLEEIAKAAAETERRILAELQAGSAHLKSLAQANEMNNFVS